jgi:hypothetical protein
VARANYLSQDRSDIRFAVKELSRHMAKPRIGDIESAKRLAKYRMGKPRAICHFRRQNKPGFIEGWSDSDWAGCLETRKSTSGGLLKFGMHVLKAWSITQNVIATSSGEAEFYAMVKAASQSLGMKVMLNDMGIKVQVKIITDATAAKGIAHRKGLGTGRHLEVGQLWIQDKIARGELLVVRVGGKVNVADALTLSTNNSPLAILSWIHNCPTSRCLPVPSPFLCAIPFAAVASVIIFTCTFIPMSFSMTFIPSDCDAAFTIA